MKNLIIVSLLLFVSSCGLQKVKFLDANAVSMTHSSVESNQNLVEIGEVNSEFCPDSLNDKGNIGLLDETISRAQKSSGADFITNAAFYRSSNGCISVTGTGKKIKMADASDSKSQNKKK